MRHARRFAPALAGLLFALAPPASALDGFDFALERLEVIGSLTFVDEFDDGLRDVAPTSRLVDRGGSHTTEAGGMLVLSDGDGADPGTLGPVMAGWTQSPEDRVSLTQGIYPASGPSEVRASFRPDVPDPGARYGLVLDSFGGGAGVAHGIAVERSPTDVLQIGPHWIDPATVQGAIVLRISLSMSSGAELRSSFSIDGGSSFTELPGVTRFRELALQRPTLLFPVLFGGAAPSTWLYGLARRPEELARSPQGALVAVQGSLHPASPWSDSFGLQIGSFAMASSGAGDLRSTPGSVVLATPGGTLSGVATRTNEARRVDPATGRPVAADAPPGAGCATGAEGDCWSPGRPLAQGRAVYDTICRTTPGTSLTDRHGCLLEGFGGAARAGNIASVAHAVSALLGGSIFANPILIALTGTGGFQLPLSVDPADGTALIANGVSQTLSAEQEALLGCGPFFGTACDGPTLPGDAPGGVDLFLSEATALLQSFLGQDGSDYGWRTNDAARTQPGTVPPPGAPLADAPCTRLDGGQVVTLPGCRGPATPGYDASVDGTSVPLLHPHTGQPFVSEVAALSFNLQGVLTAFSSPDADGGTLDLTLRFAANEGHEFDELAPLRDDGCSYTWPTPCHAQQLVRNLSVRELPDDPSGPPARRWLWETGAEYEVTGATGSFARFVGGRIHGLGPAEPRLPGTAAGTLFLLEAPLPAIPDADADGVADANDTCPALANPSQSDFGGLGSGSAPDGIGDACQCGDVNGDARVTLADAVVITRSLLAPPTAFQLRPELCDVDGSGSCTLADAVLLRRALLSPATAAIQPGCAPAQP